MAEAQRGGPEDVAGARIEIRIRVARLTEIAHDLVESLGRAPVLLLLVGRKLERNDRNGQRQRLGQPTGIVLNQFRRAGRTHDHRLRCKTLIGIIAGGLEQFRRIAAQVARLEGGVGHRRPGTAPLDHGEEQVRIGVALRRMQNVMHALHRGGDAHRPHMGRSFIGPEGELHGYTPNRIWRSKGRENRRAKSPAWS